MARIAIAILFVGVGILGLAPLVLGAFMIARRRSESSGRVLEGRRLGATIGSALAVAFVAAWYVAGILPPPAAEGHDAAEHDESSGAAAPGAAHGDPHLPDTLAGLPPVEQLTGDAAVEAVERLHAVSFTVHGAAVGRYAGAAGSADLWVARYDTPERALAETREMADRIAEGGSPFSLPRYETGVWATEGLGQLHWFFVSGPDVWWLGADAEIGEQALAETLAHAQRGTDGADH